MGIVTEEDSAIPALLSDSTEGCFSCGEWTHNTEQCQALDESFRFLPIGWVVEHNENMFILGPGPPSSPRSHQTGNDDWSGERGWSPGSAMSTDPTPNDYEAHSGTGGPIFCGDCSVDGPADTRKR